MGISWLYMVVSEISYDDNGLLWQFLHIYQSYLLLLTLHVYYITDEVKEKDDWSGGWKTFVTVGNC